MGGKGVGNLTMHPKLGSLELVRVDRDWRVTEGRAVSTEAIRGPLVMSVCYGT